MYNFHDITNIFISLYFSVFQNIFDTKGKYNLYFMKKSALNM